MKSKSLISILTLIIILFTINKVIAQTYEVGTLPGGFGVSPSGAATYAVPINLPPGRAGMTPELAFVYNNQAPSTVMGLGWGISGFSAIGRTNPTLYYNGEIDNVDFNDDQLMLDGNRLIAVDTVAGNTIYRTELDGISKVVYHPTGGYDNKEYFIVHTKGGMTKEYGLTNNSRQTYHDDNAEPLFWHLNKILDMQGNAVKYVYNKNYTFGELHPDSIIYTLFDNGNGSEASYFVEFKYTPLDPMMHQTFYFEYTDGNGDAQPYYNKNTNRLDQVLVKNIDDAKTITAYDLNYEVEEMPLAGEYCLKSIELSASEEGETSMKFFNPTTFEWSYYTPSRSRSQFDYGFEGDYIFNGRYHVLGRMDLTGHGKDVIVDYREEYNGPSMDPIRKIVLQSFNEIMELTVFEDAVYENKRAKSLIGVDFDNDGKDELLAGMTKEVWIYKFIKDGDNWSVDGDPKVFNESNDWLNPYTGDFTGDGLPDLLIVNESEAKATLYEGTGSNDPYFKTETYTFELPGEWLPDNDLQDITGVADFNGDGKTDILLEKRENIYDGDDIDVIIFDLEIHSFTGDGFEEIASLELTNEHPEYHTDKILFADVNGDGRTDIHHQLYPDEGDFNHNEINTTYHSYGKGFIEAEAFIFENNFRGALFLSDQNNDGRADMVYVKTDIVNSTGDPHNGEQYLGTTTLFTNPNGLVGTYQDTVDQKNYFLNYGEPFYPNNIASIVFADISGNGINDVVSSFFYGEQTDPSTEQSPPLKWIYSIYAFPDAVQPAANVIVGATNGFGVESNVTYQPSRSSFYSDATYTAPLALYKSKTWLVNQTYIVGENDNKLNHLIYSFTAPLTMLEGKGFLGYEKTIVYNLQQNIETHTHYNVYTEERNDKEMYFIHYPDSIVVKEHDAPNTMLSQTLNQIAVKNTVTGYDLVFIPVNTLSTSIQWDNDEQHSLINTVVTTQNLADIDNYGNSTKNKTVIGGDSEFETIVENTWVYDEENWIFNRPVKTIITKSYSADDNDDVRQLDYTYYSSGEPEFPFLETKSVTPNGNSLLATQVEYEYDTFGNIKKQTLSAPNANPQIAPRSTAFFYATDNSYDGRFLTKKTKEIGGTSYISEYEYYTTQALLKTKTFNPGPKQLKATFEYDAFGNIIRIKKPDGIYSKSNLDWVANKKSENKWPLPEAHFYQLSYKVNKDFEDDGSYYMDVIWNFFDKYGREVTSVTYDQKSLPIFVLKYYGNKGRLDSITEPHFLLDSYKSTNYEYDALNRIIKVNTPTNSIEKEYLGRTTNLTNLNTSVTKTTMVNAIGLTKNIADPVGTIAYEYYASGNIRNIDALGSQSSMKYDDAGRQIELVDADVGKTTYVYNGYGELVIQTDASNNKTEIEYDNLGRLIRKTVSKSEGDEKVTVYNYQDNVEINGFGKLENVNGSYGMSYSYTFDELNRLLLKIEIISGTDFIHSYTYDPVTTKRASMTYPSGFQVKYAYKENGYLDVITDERDNMLWQPLSNNGRGQLTDYALGNGLSTHKDFDEYGFPETIVTSEVQDLAYHFTPETGNLEWRKSTINGIELIENFGYDTDKLHSRLTGWQVQGQQTYSVGYEANGNIYAKSDVTKTTAPKGIYAYDNGKPHAVSQLTMAKPDYVFNNPRQEITYTAFNKVEKISQRAEDEEGSSDYELHFFYGPDNARKVTMLYKNTQLQKRKFFIGRNYELEYDDSGNERKLHYINGGDGLFAIYVLDGQGNGEMYYIHKDHLGSFETITDDEGNFVEKLSFDPWGRRRNPGNWSFNSVPKTHLFDRGYTGHEHLDIFGLINMNGRVYDPWLGRILSPDPIVQAPGNSQSYNRYTYVFNNPLKYTDPSGYQGGPFGPPSDYAYGPGAASEGMRNVYYDYNTSQVNWSITFGNSGFNMLGSGKHWSDQYRSEYNNYLIMSSKSYDSFYGRGSSLKASKLWSNSFLRELWKQGELSLSNYTDKGYWRKSSSVNNISYDLGNGEENLQEVEIILKWVPYFETKSWLDIFQMWFFGQHEQKVGMGIYAENDGNDGPGEGYTATEHQYPSIEWPSLGKFGDDLRNLFSSRSPLPHGFNTINPTGWDSVWYDYDSGNVSPSMGDAYMIDYYFDGVIRDTNMTIWKWPNN